MTIKYIRTTVDFDIPTNTLILSTDYKNIASYFRKGCETVYPGTSNPNRRTFAIQFTCAVEAEATYNLIRHLIASANESTLNQKLIDLIDMDNVYCDDYEGHNLYYILKHPGSILPTPNLPVLILSTQNITDELNTLPKDIQIRKT